MKASDNFESDLVDVDSCYPHTGKLLMTRTGRQFGRGLAFSDERVSVAICRGNNFYSSFPNIYAIRSTPYRDFNAWAVTLNLLLGSERSCPKKLLGWQAHDCPR